MTILIKIIFNSLKVKVEKSWLFLLLRYKLLYLRLLKNKLCYTNILLINHIWKLNVTKRQNCNG